MTSILRAIAIITIDRSVTKKKCCNLQIGIILHFIAIVLAYEP
jgi:hypothetical protein